MISRTTLDRKKTIESWEGQPDGEYMAKLMTPRAYESLLNNPQSMGKLKELPDTLFNFPIYELSKPSPDVTTVDLVEGTKKLRYHPSFVWSQNNVRVILNEKGAKLVNVHLLIQHQADTGKVQGFIPILMGFLNPGIDKTNEEAFGNTVIYYYVQEETKNIAMVSVKWDPSKGLVRNIEDAQQVAGEMISLDGLVIKHSKYCHNCGKLGDADRREPEMSHCVCDSERRYCGPLCQKADWPKHREEHYKALEAGAAGSGTGTSCLVCDVCGAPSTLRCIRCKTARYCSKDCQKAAWKEHKKQCA
jgi:hypothetical protein